MLQSKGVTLKKSDGCVLEILLAVALLCGCTLAPRIVKPARPSLDGGLPTSGILQVLTNHCYLVTPLFVERYTNLVHQYGWKLNPPMTAPRWITPTATNTFVITSDGIAAFAELDFYARQHLSP